MSNMVVSFVCARKFGQMALLITLLLMVPVSPAYCAVPEVAFSPFSEDFYTGLSLLFLVIILTLGFSFACSVAEAVLLSITPSYIESLREDNPDRSVLLKKLRYDNVDQSLAAILTLNTIAHTAGAIVSGAQATVVFGNTWIGLFSAVMTLLILFLSEIVPKTIGAVYWPQLVGVVALFVRVLILILYPLVWISEGLTRLIARGKVQHVFSRDEFIAMAGVGEEAGHIDERESKIIKNLFRFASLKVTDIMTPRVVVAAHQQDMTIAEVLASSSHIPFSRLPIYGKNMDNITGFVLKDDVLLLKSQGEGSKKLASLKREIKVVPDSISLSKLLEFFVDQRQHIAIVVDEYGGTAGLVTLEDVLETLLGLEIKDEMDNVEDMRILARQQWEKRAKMLGISYEAIQTESTIRSPSGNAEQE